MNYRSIADLNDAVVAMLPRLPRDIDLVVGVPRSGMLAGSMLALLLNKPLTDLKGLLERRLLQSGKRREGEDHDVFDVARRVLVIDDSVRSGSAMQEARAALAGLDYEMTFAAVYVTSDNQEFVDVFGESVELPRMFAWNLMHHAWLSKCCVDLDGVLCRDPEPEQNDDGPHYEEFLANAEPLYLPTVPIGRIVTARLEKYRALTEAWLAEHGVEYEALDMLDLPDGETRRRLGAHVPHKVDAYTGSRAMLFIESDPKQAAGIAEHSGRPVLCVTNQRMYYPESLTANAAAVARRVGRPLRRRLHDAAERVLDRMLARNRVRTD